MQNCAKFAAFALALLITACAPGSPNKGDTGDANRIIRISDSEVRSLDPHKISDIASLRVAADQFAGLTRLNAAGEPIAALAQRWTMSPDGRTWTFAMRADAQFSDGTAITAHTMANSFARLNDPKTASPTASLFSMITAMRATDDRTVVVTLANPLPQLPNLLAHPALAAVPLHRIIARGDAWTDERPLVTSGAYRALRWRLNARLTLEQNPMWPKWRAATAAGPKQVEWRPMDDTLAALRLYRSGGADQISEFPANRWAELRTSLGPQVHVAPYLGTYYLAFNTRKPPFNDVRVRRALSLAVERPWLAEKIVGAGARPAWGLIPPALAGGSGYQPAGADAPRATRIAAAARLLAAAGYGPNQPLTFNIRFNSSAEHRRIAVALAAMWRPLGVEAQLFNSEASLHFASLRRADFEIARSGWIADIPAPENFLSVHKSDAGVINYSGFSNLHYDALLRTALATRDPAARLIAMRAAEAVLIDDMPILPLYYYASRNLVSPRIAGWVDNASNIHPSEFLALAAPKAAPK